MGEKDSSFDPLDKHRSVPAQLKKFYVQDNVHDDTVFGRIIENEPVMTWKQFKKNCKEGDIRAEVHWRAHFVGREQELLDGLKAAYDSESRTYDTEMLSMLEDN